jgi:uncharacterized membrane protein YbhN (UPF0104 family)
VRLAVGIALLVYLAESRIVDFRALTKLITAWPITLAALVLIFLDIALMAVRLCRLFEPQGLRLPLADSLELMLVSSFFATFLPGAAGGDLAKLFYAAAAALAILLLSPGSPSPKMCLVIPVGHVANSLPLTPGGLGVGEAAFNALFRLAGLQGGAEALLCWHIWRAMVGLVGLAQYLRGLGRAVFDAEQASHGWG